MMPQIKYIESDGTEHLVEVPIGQSLMEGAVRNGVSGIAGDCGGAGACATCHVYIDEASRNKVGEISALETEMLEFVQNSAPNSRLSCQIKSSEALDQLVVYMPESQY
jgi:2Fe-2S ferredoxin